MEAPTNSRLRILTWSLIIALLIISVVTHVGLILRIELLDDNTVKKHAMKDLEAKLEQEISYLTGPENQGTFFDSEAFLTTEEPEMGTPTGPSEIETATEVAEDQTTAEKSQMPQAACLAEHENATYADGVCYFQITTNGINWYDAKDLCESLDSTLASPQTWRQWQAVYELSALNDSWIGFRELSEEYEDDGLTRRWRTWMNMAGKNVSEDLGWWLKSSSYGDCAYTESYPYSTPSWPIFVEGTVCHYYLHRLICEEREGQRTVSSSDEDCKAPNGYNSAYAEGVCYFYIREELNWYDAKDYCESLNATLASPVTWPQWKAVYELSRVSSAWIGFRQIPSDGPWLDMAGNDSADTMNPWWIHETFAEESGEDCVHVSSRYTWPELIKDNYCHENGWLICEKKGSCVLINITLSWYLIFILSCLLIGTWA